MIFVMFWHDFVHLVIWKLLEENRFNGREDGEELAVFFKHH